MPASAEQALAGLLAEGVSPEDVLMALEGGGFQVTPPAGDMSYPGPESAGGPPIGVEIELSSEGPEETPEGEDKPKKRPSTEEAVSNAFEKHKLK